MAESPTPDSKIPADIAKLGFEEALAELEGIVRQLEEGKGKLEDAIKAYARGALLKRHCEKKLEEAKAKVEKIVLGASGPTGLAPVERD
ncbi:MAG TPA: exodeoxyribonuclease VII small subunit [Alphaproteobacteria bacterium]|nr:exodeoxyribonuclease VII small subunit [Alphaproteobacteria bacterium]